MSGRDGVVPTTLDVTPTVSGKRNVRRGVETKARRSVNDKSASHAALKVVEGNLAVRERRESMLFISGKVSLLEANDIALGDEVDKGPEDKVLPAVAGDVGSVVREAVNVVRKKARNEGGSGGEGGKTRGGLRERGREGKWGLLFKRRERDIGLGPTGGTRRERRSGRRGEERRERGREGREEGGRKSGLMERVGARRGNGLRKGPN